MKNEENYILGINIFNGKIYENIKLDNKSVYLRLTKNSYIINDRFIACFDLFNFEVKIVNNETIYTYDGYINYETSKEVLVIKKNENNVRFYLLKAYFFEHVFRRKLKLKFYDTDKNNIFTYPKDTRKKDVFFNIGFNLYNLPYYINLSKKNYEGNIKKDLKSRLLYNKEIMENTIIANKHIDLIPIYFKNEALHILKNNRDIVSYFNHIIHRQENNFFIFTKDIHSLVNENNIFLDKLEFFNYYDETCYMEERWKEVVYEGRFEIRNKNKFDILNSNIKELCINLKLNENKMLNILKDIIIPTEINNEIMFSNNVRLIFEEIIKTVTDHKILKNKRDNLPNYKLEPKDPPEVMNKYLAKITGKSEKYFHSIINPVKNFRNMYSHNKGSYNKNYEENYKFVRNGEPNKYRLNEDPQKNDFNFLSHKMIEDVNSFLETINIYFKDNRLE